MRRTKAEAEQTRQQIINAAREVFHECGTSRSTLEDIAARAGVTRGAVYWHFRNKTDLFFAMRAQAVLPLIDGIDEVLFDDTLDDPLDGIEQALYRMVQSLRADPIARDVFRIASLRCEYVGEFAIVLDEFKKYHVKRLAKLELAYQRAQDKRTLRPGLSPKAMALDTMTFYEGMLRRFSMESGKGVISRNVRKMIRDHVALRRR